MQIVIELPDKDYENFKLQAIGIAVTGILSPSDKAKLAIANGKPLPKCHGDLKDVGNIRLDKFVRIENFSLNPKFSEDYKKGYNDAVDDVVNVLFNAKTIIEADKGA